MMLSGPWCGENASRGGRSNELSNNDQVTYLSINRIEDVYSGSFICMHKEDVHLNWYEMHEHIGVQPMANIRKQQSIITLDNKGVETLNIKLAENRNKADLFEIGIGSFIGRATPEDLARFGIALIKLSPFLRKNIIISFFRQDPSRIGLDDLKLKEMMFRTIEKGFGWLEIDPEIDYSTIVEARDLTVKTGTKLMIMYDTMLLGLDKIEKVLWSADGIKMISIMSNLRDIRKMMTDIRSIRDITTTIPIYLRCVGPYSIMVQSISPFIDVDGVYIDIHLTPSELINNEKNEPSPGFSHYLIKRHLGLTTNLQDGSLFLPDRSITPETKFYLFAGRPLKESMEVILHNHAFDISGLDAIMIPVDMGADSLDRFILTTKELDSPGFGITMPLKTLMAKKVSSLDDHAIRLGCINAVKVGRDGPIGYNTEYNAMRDVLMKYNKDPDSRIMILGSGGAGKSFAAASNDMGFKTFICGSIPERTLAIAKSIGPNVGSVSIRAIPRLKGRIDFLINATPEGVKLIEAGNTARIGIDEIALMLEPEFGLDLIYSPPWTPFLSIIESRGGIPVSGLEVLVHQVMNTHNLWTGMTIDYSELRKTAMEAHPYILND